MIRLDPTPGTLDLSLSFASGNVLQLVPDSAGYETWNISHGDMQYTAVGGGELTVLDWGSKRGASNPRRE